MTKLNWLRRCADKICTEWTEGLAHKIARTGHLRLGIKGAESHPMRAKPYGDPERTGHHTLAVIRM